MRTGRAAASAVIAAAGVLLFGLISGRSDARTPGKAATATDAGAAPDGKALSAAIFADAPAKTARKEAPALDPATVGRTGKVAQDFNLFNGFAYEWSSPAGKLRLEFVKADLEEREAAGLYVTAIVDGVRKPVVEFRDVNAGAKTWLLVKPVKKRRLLGVAIMSDWIDGKDTPAADRAVEIRWDGKQVRVVENAGSWAK